MCGGSGKEGLTQHIEEYTSDRVAHLVFFRRCAPVHLKKIRDLKFSDLRGGKNHKRYDFMID
ncbi:hypothetical protein DRF02_24480 [Salmonella enterica subsp. salamae]|nr:hypothetical protein [Salmonella enterica]ECC9297428.1 hypothetical protein [Salmonella enterica subsp. salamae]